MLSLLTSLALHLSPAPEAPSWAPIVAFDEVRVEADTARVTGAGPFTLWLRWSFLDRASSPQSWDAGVRGSVDYVEIDCERAAIRTFSSLAYGADGSAVPSASVDEPAAAWRVPRAESIGGYVTRQVCELARARR
jgi:hypothetical protein